MMLWLHKDGQAVSYGFSNKMAFPIESLIAKQSPFHKILEFQIIPCDQQGHHCQQHKKQIIK